MYIVTHLFIQSNLSESVQMNALFPFTRKQGESQASVHQCQVNDLESAISVLRSKLLDTQQGHEDKVTANTHMPVVM